MSSPLALAIIEALKADPQALGELRALLDLDAPGNPDAWLDSRDAARHIGRTRQALYELTAERRIPFEQECRGSKLWFRRSELDAWMRGETRCQNAAPLP